MPLPSRCKSFLAATWALGEGGNGSAARGGAGLTGLGRGEEGPGGAGRGGARRTVRPGGGGGRAARLRARGCEDCWGTAARGPGRSGARGGRGARAVAPGPAAQLPARRRSTQRALA